MGSYVYLAAYYYSEGYKFLIARKKYEGSFFQGQEIFPPRPLHGGGSWCFPGGGRNLKLNIVDDAFREFEEETGVSLTEFYIQDPIDIVLSSGNICSINYENSIYLLYGIEIDYAVVFVYLPILGELPEYINTRNLGNKNRVPDDELNRVELHNYEECLRYFRFSDYNTTGWFINALQTFNNQCLNNR